MNDPKFTKMREIVDDYNYEGKCHLKLCLDILLYYEGGFLENKEGILHFYKSSLELIRDHVKYHLIDGEGKYKKNNKDTLNLLPFWASGDALERDIYGLYLESGTKPIDFSDVAFQTYNDGIDPGWIRLILPVEFIENGVENFVALAKTAAEKLKFLSGTAGYAVNMRHGYPAYLDDGRVYMISRRYHGIDLGSPLYFSKYLDRFIKCANWLTFIGNGFIELLEGKSILRNKLGQAIIIHDLPDGIMIQACPEPGFGDVNRRDTLPHYHEVGRALKGLRIPEPVLGPYDEIGGEENTKKWLARFDNENSK